MSNVKSFKSANVDGNEFWILETMYRFSDKKYSHLSDEELEEYFCKQDISLKKQYSKVSTTLKYKGNLRISWAFDMQYNKNIDCIFFPEDNPYINYVALYARDFPKNIDKDDRYGIDRMLSANSLKIPYDINYDFVRGILLQDSLNKSNISPQYDKSLKEDLSNLETFLSHNLSQKSLQEQFFKVRFGSVFVPMEIEFEWYVVPWYIEYSPLLGKTYIQDIITFPNYDMYLHGVLDTPDPLGLCLGIIKSAKPLTQDTTIKFPPYIASWSEEEYNEQSQMNEEVTKHMSYAQIFTPLSTTALATTQTYVNDYIINLRDTPNKEGKIVAQLLTDSLKLPKDFFIQTHNGGVGYSHLSHGSGGAIAINPKYHKITELGSALYRKDTGDSSDWEVCFL